MKTLIFDLDGTLVRLQPQLICIARVPFLRALRKRYDFALVTGSPKDEVLRTLAECELTQFFDREKIVTKDDVQGDKASGIPFFEIMRRLPGAAVMVGDSDGDEIGSRKAGIPFVRVQTTQTQKLQRKYLEEAVANAVSVLEGAKN